MPSDTKTFGGIYTNVLIFFITGSALSVFTGFIMLLLLVPGSWMFCVSRAQKTLLIGIFGLRSL